MHDTPRNEFFFLALHRRLRHLGRALLVLRAAHTLHDLDAMRSAPRVEALKEALCKRLLALHARHLALA